MKNEIFFAIFVALFTDSVGVFIAGQTNMAIVFAFWASLTKYSKDF
jgi:hypothetical protein